MTIPDSRFVHRFPPKQRPSTRYTIQNQNQKQKQNQIQIQKLKNKFDL